MLYIGFGLMMTGVSMCFFDQTARYGPVVLSAGLGTFGLKKFFLSEQASPDFKKIK